MAHPTLVLPEFTPSLSGFRADEFLALTETLLAFPIEQDGAQLDAAPFRLERPEPRPEPPLPPLPPRWYPRPAAEVVEAARALLAAPPRPTIFEGRAHELARVLRPLLSGHPVRVRGELGLGKTTLLAAVATHERTRQRFRRIWWIDDAARLDQTLALALHLPQALVEPGPDQRRRWLAEHLDDHTLLVVDNLRPDDPLAEALLKLTDHVLLAVETPPRAPDDEPPPDDPEGVVTLWPLDDNAAVDALGQHAGLDDIRRLRGQLARIAAALGRHPYALTLAGVLVRRDGLALDALEELVAAPPEAAAAKVDAEPDKADQAREQSPDEAGAGEVAAPAADEVAPWWAALQRLLALSVAALPADYRRLFEAFAAFPPVGAPLDGLQTVTRLESPLAVRRGLHMLADYALIRRDHRQPDHFEMHLIAYARAAAQDDEHPAQSKQGKAQRTWALQFVRAHADDALALYRAEPALLHAYHLAREHGPVYVDGPLAEALRPYLQTYVPGLPEGDTGAPPELSGPRAEASELTRQGIELTDQGAHYVAEEVLKRALALRRDHANPHAIAETLVALARLLDAVGRYQEAADALVEAAELVFKLGADDSLSVARRGLARVYRHMGRLNDALGVLDDAPEAHVERAAIYRAQGHYDAAVREIAHTEGDDPYDRAEIFLLAGQYADALQVIGERADPDSAHMRAQVHHLQGRFAEAIEAYRAALACCDGQGETSGDGGSGGLMRAKILRGLGAALAADRQWEAAHAALEQALALYQQADAPDPVLVGRTLRLRAAVHLVCGDTAQAAADAREAIAQLKRGSAPDDLADAYRTLGRALWRQDDCEGALTAFEGEVKQAEEAAGRDDRRIGVALHHLADAYRALGSSDRAVGNYRRALTHKNPAHDPQGCLITQFALHRSLLESERLPAAHEAIQELVDFLARQPQLDLRRYGYAQALRARTQQAMERPIRAGQTLHEWVRVLAQRGADALTSPDPALRLLALGLAVRSLLADGRSLAALPLAEQALALADREVPRSPAAWAACRDVGEVYLALDRPEEAILTLEPLLRDEVRATPGQLPTYALAQATIGRAYRAIDEPDGALAHLRIAFEHEPDALSRALLQESIADLLLETRQPSEAVESLHVALPLVDRKEYPDVAARLLTRLASTLGGLNRYADAIHAYEEALTVLRDVPDVSPTHTADVLRALGQTHEAQGQRPEAAQAYRRALNLLERADAPRARRDVLHLLARVVAALGEPSAVQLYEQVREATEQWGDGDELGQVLCEMASVHRDAGRLPLAILHYQQALAHQPAPPLIRDRINTLRNLGRAYAQMERYDEGRAVWTEALTLSQAIPDESPQEIALTHHAIGEAYRHQKLYAEAEQSYREALQFHEPRSAEAAATLRALGAVLLAQDRAPDAVEPLRAALDAEKTQPQQAYARLIETLRLLAEAHEDADDLDAAIVRYHEALVYMDVRLQPVAYAEMLRTLAGLYADARNYTQAHAALKAALEIEGDCVPRSDERISSTLQAIADLYRAQGDLAKAAEYYQRVTVYTNLARRASDDLRATLGELDRRRGTLQAAQQSLALLDRSDRADLKDVAFIQALIARSYAGLNQPQESAETIRTLLEMLGERRADLSSQDDNGDSRALAWLGEAHLADAADELDRARTACTAALNAVANSNLRWVIQQVMRSLPQQ